MKNQILIQQPKTTLRNKNLDNQKNQRKRFFFIKSLDNPSG
jgi:hypothetical protein